MLTRTLLMGVLVAGVCLAQGEPAKPGAGATTEPRYFHLDFVIKELDAGKTINSKSYSMTVSTNKDRTSVRSGDKVPIRTTPPNTQYIDVGTNIDCWNAGEVQGQLALMVTADYSSTADVSNASVPEISPAPVIRQVKWNSPVIVPLRKATVIFTSDVPSSKRQMELELTATPIN
jgi:hypothetical protein